MLPEKIIFIGIVVNVALSLWYIKKILSNDIKPNLVSWAVWSIAPIVGFFLHLKAGAGWAASGVFIAGFFPLVTVVVLLLKKDSYWKISLFDIACGGLAILAFVFYLLTKNLGISILFAILGDGLALIPTLRKTWNFPETESPSTYAGGIFNNIVSLLIIKNWSFAIYSLPVYFVLANTIIVFCIYRKKIIEIFS